MPPFGVIFDADGVLFDSERQSLEALRLAVEAVTASQVQFTPDLFAFFCGRDDGSIVEFLNKNYRLSLDRAQFRQFKLECYRRVIACDPISVSPGAIALIDRLVAASVPYAIATAAIRAKLDLSLATVGLADRFPVITSVDEVSAGKPDPGVFLLTARRLGLDPKRIVVFEDSPNGIAAANCAGMFSVGVVGTFPRERLSQARQIVENLVQVSVPLLRQWLNGQTLGSIPTGGD